MIFICITSSIQLDIDRIICCVLNLHWFLPLQSFVAVDAVRRIAAAAAFHLSPLHIFIHIHSPFNSIVIYSIAHACVVWILYVNIYSLAAVDSD